MRLQGRPMGDIKGTNSSAVYNIEVDQDWFGSGITVQMCHGYDWLEVDGMRWRYRNIEAFLGDWEIVHSTRHIKVKTTKVKSNVSEKGQQQKGKRNTSRKRSSRSV